MTNIYEETNVRRYSAPYAGPPEIAPPSFFLETYPGAAFAYSTRKLSIFNQQCVRVRRSSDNQEMDFGFLALPDVYGNNMIHEQAILDFVGSGDGFVTTWYDLTGNGKHAVAVNTLQQTRIVIGGVFAKSVVGQPAIRFDGGRRFTQPNGQDIFRNVQYAALFTVMQREGTSQQNLYSTGVNTGTLTRFNQLMNASAQLVTNARLLDGQSEVTANNQNLGGTYKQLTSEVDHLEGTVKSYVNGISGSTSNLPATGSTPNTSSAATPIIGVNLGGTDSFTGWVSEMIAYNTNQEVNRDNIIMNQRLAFFVS